MNSPAFEVLSRWGRRFAFIAAGTLGGAAASTFTQVLLLRNTSAAVAGSALGILALANFLQPLANLSLPILIAQLDNKPPAHDAASCVRGARLILSFSLLGAACGMAAYWHATHLSGSPLIAFALIPLVSVFPIVELWTAKEQVDQRFRVVGVLQGAVQVTRLAAISALLMFDTSPSLAGIVVACAAAALPLCVIGSSQLVSWMRQAAASQSVGWRPFRVLRACLPYILLTAVTIGLGQIAIVIVSATDPVAAASVGGGILIMNAISLLPSILYGKVLFTRIAEWSRSDRSRFVALLRLGVVAMPVLGCLLAVLLYSARNFLGVLLFQQPDPRFGELLGALSLVLPIRFLVFAITSVLVLQATIHLKLRNYGIGAIAYLAILCSLLPHSGMLAVAWASLAADSLMLVLHWRTVLLQVPELNGRVLQPLRIGHDIRRVLVDAQ